MDSGIDTVSWNPLAVTSPIEILFDVDGTLIATGGAGTRSWRWAFGKLHGIPADIGEFSDAGMTDPVVARRTFRGVMGREPSEREMARLLAAYLERLLRRSRPPALTRCSREPRSSSCASARGLLLGIVTGALGAAARIGSRAPAQSVLLLRRVWVRFRRPDRAHPPGGRARSSILGDELAPARVYVVGDTPKDIERPVALMPWPSGSPPAITRARL